MVVCRLTISIVNAHQDTKVLSCVRARNLLNLCRSERATTSNLDLRTASVELGLAHAAGTVKSNELDAEKILTGGNTARHGEVVPSVAGDDVVDAPGTRGSVEVVFGNLEPVGAFVGSSSRVIDLGQPVGDRTLVGRGDGVVRMVLAVDVGPPVATNLSTRRNAENRAICGASLTARQVRRVDVLNGEVDARGAQADELAYVLAIDGDCLVGSVQEPECLGLGVVKCRTCMIAWALAKVARPKVTRVNFMVESGQL